MNVVLYGASGMVGSRVLKELVSRGHQVTAVVRNPSKVPASPGVKVVQGDALDAKDVAAKVAGADAVISSYAPPADKAGTLLEAVHALIAGTKEAGVKRLLVVGGAGSLLVAPGVDVIDSGHLPAEYMEIAIAHRDALKTLKSAELDWTYFSPAAFIQPGERTGKFRLGGDSLIADEKGTSSISAEDYAIALVDELERPAHVRQRFTIGY
jgi:putative NADH-flavin reductase